MNRLWENIQRNDNSILKLNPPANFKSLFNQFNELTAESNKKSPENFINCRNLDIDEIQNMKIEPNSLFLYFTYELLFPK